MFLAIGVHHAREWPSGELSIEFAVDLVESFGVSPRLTQLLRQVRVIIVPVLNVDGFEQSRTWGDLVPIVDDDGGKERGAPDNLGNLNKRKNCRVVDGRNAAGRLRRREPRRLRRRRRPQPQLRMALGRPGALR